VLGVTGYRKLAAKVNAAARVLHPEREIATFARDVQEGMRLYRASHDGRTPRLEYSDPMDSRDG
jgi:hypothetical protein